MKAGLLFRPGSLWIGAHWSPHHRRWCINLVPCVTIWIALRGGIAPGEDDPREWIDRAAFVAKWIIFDTLDKVVAARGQGTGLPHLRWMAQQLADRNLESPTKACRWLGYLQGSLVAQGLSSLPREKYRNLYSNALR